MTIYAALREDEDFKIAVWKAINSARAEGLTVLHIDLVKRVVLTSCSGDVDLSGGTPGTLPYNGDV